jgi:thiol-disulfide isomerase/thioredoxin
MTFVSSSSAAALYNVAVRLALLACFFAGCGGTGRHPPSVANDPGYPVGPYGYAAGEVIPDLQFVAKSAAPGESFEWKSLETVALGGFRAARFVVIEVGARWCPDCNADQPAMMKLESDYAQKSVVGLEILDEGAYQVAATSDDIGLWSGANHVTGTIAIDDHWAFALAADVTAIPLYFVVDTRDMRIVDRTAATLAQRPLGPVLDGLLAR